MTDTTKVEQGVPDFVALRSDQRLRGGRGLASGLVHGLIPVADGIG